MYDNGASKRNADSFVHERCTGHNPLKIAPPTETKWEFIRWSIETNMVHEAGRKNVTSGGRVLGAAVKEERIFPRRE